MSNLRVRTERKLNIIQYIQYTLIQKHSQLKVNKIKSYNKIGKKRWKDSIVEKSNEPSDVHNLPL